MPCTTPLLKLHGLRDLVQQLAAEVEKVEAWGQNLQNDNALLPDAAPCCNPSPLKRASQATSSGDLAQPAPRSKDIVSLDDVLETTETLAVPVWNSSRSMAGSGRSTYFGKVSVDSVDAEVLEMDSHGSFRSSCNRSSCNRPSVTAQMQDQRRLSRVQLQIDANLEWQRRANELHMWFEGLLSKEPAIAEALPSKTIQSLLINANSHSSRTIKWVESILATLNEAVDNLFGKEEDNSGYHANEDAMGLHRKPLMRWASIYRGTLRQSVAAQSYRNTISFRGFVELILWSRLEQVLTDDEKLNILEIREALIIQSVDQIIYEFLNLNVKGEAGVAQQPFALLLIDPCIAIVLIINAFTLGVSSDTPWDGWVVCESVFTVFFVMEILIKVCLAGFFEHFCGPDKYWNAFDLFVVGMALFDLVITFFASQHNDMHNFTLVRLARLAKITRLMRLIRLLRLRCFKELLLMVKGVVAGMRTLVWAFVLLATLIYILGVMLRQTVGEDRIRVVNDPYNTVLFNSIGWSMFTIFRCSITDCTLPNGTPLVAHLYERYGPTFGIPYAFVTLFVTFGIFNLIMAVFVENVVESARVKQKLTQQGERIRVCRNLRGLVMRFGGGEPVEPWQPQTPDFMASIFRRFKHALGKPHAHARDTRQHYGVSFLLGGQISREMFHEVINAEDVHDLLDELQIHTSDRSELFDVIDADRSGIVDVSELINGLLKMRSGGADKSDIVATILGIRSLQKQLSTFMENSLENQAMIRNVLESPS